MPKNTCQRVVCYVDGFNLYHGIIDSKLRRYLWLDVHKMASRLLFSGQQLVAVKYFTARIIGARPGDRETYAAKRDAKRKRQTTYLDALKTLPEVQIFYGHYLDREINCFHCGSKWSTSEEKMTDVSIATEMLLDTFANSYDVILLVSGDSDLVPPIKAIRELFPYKRINIAFPPSRQSQSLKRVAHGECVIHKGTLRKSQFSEEVTGHGGYILKRPAEWASGYLSPRRS